MMINTDKTFCTYENIYYEMWEIAGRYTEIAQFQVIGKSHDDRMIPMVQIGKGAEDCFLYCKVLNVERDAMVCRYILCIC